MRTVITVVSLISCLCASPLLAQDWGAVQSLPPDAIVRIEEQAVRGDRVRGRIVSVEDAQLTLRVRDNPMVIPRASIARIELERRDSLWNGLVLGAVFSAVMRVAFADEACSRTKDPGCTLQGIAVGAGLGALIDSRFKGRRLIYDAAQPPVTFLRVSF